MNSAEEVFNKAEAIIKKILEEAAQRERFTQAVINEAFELSKSKNANNNETIKNV